MVWFIVLASLAAVCGIGYLFLPVLKKMKGIKPSTKAKDNKEVKKSIRADKKQQKASKKLEKQLEKQEKIVPVKAESVEDPDTKVIENNLDLDGFFNTDFSSQKKDLDDEDSLKASYDDLFDDLFSSEYRANTRKVKDDFYDIVSSDDEEIVDYLDDDIFDSDNKDMAKMIKDLPPEIKAIMLSNVFDKKDI